MISPTDAELLACLEIMAKGGHLSFNFPPDQTLREAIEQHMKEVQK